MRAVSPDGLQAAWLLGWRVRFLFDGCLIGGFA
jgi:hypothetical protein